jgi:excisionase family DNA binding protein
MNATKTKTLLSVGEAAEVIGASKNTIRNWIAQGKLPAVRIGERIIRIRPADLAALITPVGEQEC